jgi:hypothetical protein
MKWIFQRFFSPLKCAACPDFSVRHAPIWVCDLLRFHCATCSDLCTLTLVIQPANLPYIPDTHIGITNDGIL